MLLCRPRRRRAWTSAFAEPSHATTRRPRWAKRSVRLPLAHAGSKIDPYTHAHLSECKLRIDKALEAQYIRNAGGGGFGGFGGMFFGQPETATEGK